ncbi:MULTISPECIES: hypothetical protein [Achromobacter]|uniref:Uncharacterized protein n=1 Tax=Achromobacter spanius TaxID=217203 RepID=A0ABY8GYI3_9BURK|nr:MULTISPECIES: hypothetical protein [Achromobacter]WAI81217.1 hypothetical protein N8Z00_16855 [Achromobacter spanius]WEX96735.1 hypothetical protein N3Z32_11460 [Achromobacter sp. SS2-2022]WFP09549.1 hypothetical protein P8T11_06650 [Achromobacter spanius]
MAIIAAGKADQYNIVVAGSDLAAGRSMAVEKVVHFLASKAVLPKSMLKAKK